jgi:hypothetical protein
MQVEMILQALEYENGEAVFCYLIISVFQYQQSIILLFFQTHFIMIQNINYITYSKGLKACAYDKFLFLAKIFFLFGN